MEVNEKQEQMECVRLTKYVTNFSWKLSDTVFIARKVHAITQRGKKAQRAGFDILKNFLITRSMTVCQKLDKEQVDMWEQIAKKYDRELTIPRKTKKRKYKKKLIRMILVLMSRTDQDMENVAGKYRINHKELFDTSVGDSEDAEYKPLFGTVLACKSDIDRYINMTKRVIKHESN